MPPLNFERGNPGTFITEDRRYLYVFQGFKTVEGSELYSHAINTIERLDLQNSNRWEMVQGGELYKKGCFTMYPMYNLAQ